MIVWENVMTSVSKLIVKDRGKYLMSNLVKTGSPKYCI